MCALELNFFSKKDKASALGIGSSFIQDARKSSLSSGEQRDNFAKKHLVGYDSQLAQKFKYQVNPNAKTKQEYLTSTAATDDNKKNQNVSDSEKTNKTKSYLEDLKNDKERSSATGVQESQRELSSLENIEKWKAAGAKADTSVDAGKRIQSIQAGDRAAAGLSGDFTEDSVDAAAQFWGLEPWQGDDAGGGSAGSTIPNSGGQIIPGGSGGSGGGDVTAKDLEHAKKGTDPLHKGSAPKNWTVGTSSSSNETSQANASTGENYTYNMKQRIVDQEMSFKEALGQMDGKRMGGQTSRTYGDRDSETLDISAKNKAENGFGIILRGSNHGVQSMMAKDEQHVKEMMKAVGIKDENIRVAHSEKEYEAAIKDAKAQGGDLLYTHAISHGFTQKDAGGAGNNENDIAALAMQNGSSYNEIDMMGDTAHAADSFDHVVSLITACHSGGFDTEQAFKGNPDSTEQVAANDSSNDSSQTAALASKQDDSDNATLLASANTGSDNGESSYGSSQRINGESSSDPEQELFAREEKPSESVDPEIVRFEAGSSADSLAEETNTDEAFLDDIASFTDEAAMSETSQLSRERAGDERLDAETEQVINGEYDSETDLTDFMTDLEADDTTNFMEDLESSDDTTNFMADLESLSSIDDSLDSNSIDSVSDNADNNSDSDAANDSADAGSEEPAPEEDDEKKNTES